MMPNCSEIVLYQTEDGQTKIDVRFEDGAAWLSLDKLARLFQRDKSTISRHIKNIFAEGELDQNSVVANFATTAADGKTYQVDNYNLDVIIAVGYRVKSSQGTYFRQWATQILHEYLQKGFAMNDSLLKAAGGGSYWEELLERIRDIRSSEKVLYRQVLDLYATSMDYKANTKESVAFFKIVQNKMHFAVSGQTAAELVFARADADKPFMGLTSFEGSHPHKSEVGIAKNYMNEDELFTLNRLVSAFFDLAELKARAHEPMYMKDWVAELDKFTGIYGKGTLQGSGSVKHEKAIQKAESEYRKYRQKIAGELSPVERDYLTSLKETQKKLEKKAKGSGKGENK
jgi:hypothetical protein